MTDAPIRYWEERKDLRYYSEALRLCRKYSAGASSVLEVGPRDTPFLEWLDWIPRKVAIDLEVQPALKGAENIRGDFMRWQPPEKFGMAVCLQVLEHLPDVTPFAQKLLQSAEVLIVSVPYRWPAGACKYHCQDPVDLPKMTGWFQREPTEYVVANDSGVERLVAAYAPLT